MYWTQAIFVTRHSSHSDIGCVVQLSSQIHPEPILKEVSWFQGKPRCSSRKPASKFSQWNPQSIPKEVKHWQYWQQASKPIPSNLQYSSSLIANWYWSLSNLKRSQYDSNLIASQQAESWQFKRKPPIFQQFGSKPILVVKSNSVRRNHELSQTRWKGSWVCRKEFERKQIWNWL